MKTACPHCQQKYEVEDRLINQFVHCDQCEQDFIVEPLPRPLPSPPAPSAEAPQSSPNVISTNVKQGALIGAWVCLGLGALINIFSNLLFFLYAPLYFAAFILAIIAMSQRRILGGILALILSIIIMPCIIAINFVRSTHEADRAVNQDQEVAPSVEVNQRQADPSTASPASPPPQTIDKQNTLSGLCGIKFGDVFKKNRNPQNSQLTSGEVMYHFVPAKKFMGFTDYYVMTTPISDRVYAVWISQDFESGAMAREEFKKVSAVLESHYKIEGQRESFSINPMLNYKFDNGHILLKCDWDALGIRAYSDEFEALNEKEKKEAAIRSTDTSAL